jgi:hypothetical protein
LVVKQSTKIHKSRKKEEILLKQVMTIQNDKKKSSFSLKIEEKGHQKSMTLEEYREWGRKRLKVFVRKLAIIMFLVLIAFTVISTFILYKEILRELSLGFEENLGEFPRNFYEQADWIFDELKEFMLVIIIVFDLFFVILALFAILILFLFSNIVPRFSEYIDDVAAKKLSLTDSFRKRLQMIVVQHYNVDVRRFLVLFLIILVSMTLGALKYLSSPGFTHEVMESTALMGLALILLYFSYVNTKRMRELKLGIRQAKKYLQLELISAFRTILMVLFFIYSAVPLILLFDHMERKAYIVFLRWYTIRFLTNVGTKLEALEIPISREIPQLEFVNLDLLPILKEFSSLLPYLFLFLVLIFVFIYLIPSYYLDKVKNRQIKLVLITFVLGYFLTRMIYFSFPILFQLNVNSLIFGTLLALIAYIGGEFIESELTGLVYADVFCPRCKKKNPLGAEFCNFCGEKLRKSKKGKSS